MKNIDFKNAVKWASVSIAIIAGLMITKNANCLWAFFIPLLSD